MIRGAFQIGAARMPPGLHMPLGKAALLSTPYGTGTAVLFVRSLRFSNSTASEKAIEK
jgi:hypothetical protein